MLALAKRVRSSTLSKGLLMIRCKRQIFFIIIIYYYYHYYSFFFTFKNSSRSEQIQDFS